MLDMNSIKFLTALYRDGSMSVEVANRLTGFLDNERNLVTSTLQSLGYIEYVQGEYVQNEQGDFVEGDSKFQITIIGRGFLEQRKKDAFNFWIPYTITTVIAIASLIVAILSLFRC